MCAVSILSHILATMVPAHLAVVQLLLCPSADVALPLCRSLSWCIQHCDSYFEHYQSHPGNHPLAWGLIFAPVIWGTHYAALCGMVGATGRKSSYNESQRFPVHHQHMTSETIQAI